LVRVEVVVPDFNNLWNAWIEWSMNLVSIAGFKGGKRAVDYWRMLESKTSVLTVNFGGLFALKFGL